MRVLGLALLFLACVVPAYAAPNCESSDVVELCAIAKETLGDNPAFEVPEEWTTAAEQARAQRHAKRRARAAQLLNGVASPTWRDLYNAGYTISYGDTRHENLSALAIAIRALSLAPNEPEVRHLVAMTTDKIGRTYVGRNFMADRSFSS